MATYDKKSLLDKRYQLLATSSIYTYQDDNLTSYADFLRKFGRYLSKDGFVDSNQAIHRANLKEKAKTERKTKSEHGSPDSNARKEIKFDIKSVDLASLKPEKEKQHERHLKVIEDQMIKSKQDERAFKRNEGDVKKEQRQVRQSVRENKLIWMYLKVISKKRLEADKVLAKNLEERKTLEIENAHKKEKKTKERTEQNVDIMLQSKDKGRKTLLVCNDLSRQYKLKMSELDIKKTELNTLHNDFEQKIRRKEEDEAKIKKELAEIALALNMETIKARNDLFDFRKMVDSSKEKNIKADLSANAELEEKIAKTSNYIKSYDTNKKRMSLENDQTQAQWALRQREAQRRIVDTRNNLESIYQKQRSLNEAARIADKEKKANELEKKMEEITTRRTQLQSKALIERIEKNEEHESLFKTKAVHKFTELQVKDHQDHLKHFQKLTSKDEELEQDLYKNVKEAEFQRRKKENELKKLQDEFNEMKKQNAVRVKEVLAKAHADEQDFQQKIFREKAKLDKVTNDREDNYLKLLTHREKVKEDKFLLETHEKEHMRLIRLVEKNKIPDS